MSVSFNNIAEKCEKNSVFDKRNTIPIKQFLQPQKAESQRLFDTKLLNYVVTWSNTSQIISTANCFTKSPVLLLHCETLWVCCAEYNNGMLPVTGISIWDKRHGMGLEVKFVTHFTQNMQCLNGLLSSLQCDEFY